MSVISREISISSKSYTGKSVGKIGMLIFYITVPLVALSIYINIITGTRKSMNEIKYIKRDVLNVREQIESLKYKKSKLLQPDNIRKIAQKNGYVSSEGKVLKYYVESERLAVGK